MRRAWRLAVFLAACQSPPAVLGQAVSATTDASTPISWVDVAVLGCPKYDPALPGCSGPAPLDLRFTAISMAAPPSYVWSFGDGSPVVSGATPSHRFARTGTYTVSVIAGGPAGTVQTRRDMFVTVTAGGVGAECATGGCATGLMCLCGSGCPGYAGPGFCVERCDDASHCKQGSVCVDPGPRGLDDGWPTPACVRACATDGDCAAGHRCQDLPGPMGGWVRGCFPPGPLGDEGAACLDALGQASDHRCLGGDCADLGARGLCAATCDVLHPCPPYAECATFNDGTRRCLTRCSGERPCDRDPFLACEVSSAAGTLGFTIADKTVQLCAPRRCSDAGSCGPEGACVAFGSAKFCAKKSN